MKDVFLSSWNNLRISCDTQTLSSFQTAIEQLFEKDEEYTVQLLTSRALSWFTEQSLHDYSIHRLLEMLYSIFSKHLKNITSILNILVSVACQIDLSPKRPYCLHRISLIFFTFIKCVKFIPTLSASILSDISNVIKIQIKASLICCHSIRLQRNFILNQLLMIVYENMPSIQPQLASLIYELITSTIDMNNINISSNNLSPLQNQFNINRSSSNISFSNNDYETLSDGFYSSSFQKDLEATLPSPAPQQHQYLTKDIYPTYNRLKLTYDHWQLLISFHSQGSSTHPLVSSHISLLSRTLSQPPARTCCNSHQLYHSTIKNTATLFIKSPHNHKHQASPFTPSSILFPCPDWFHALTLQLIVLMTQPVSSPPYNQHTKDSCFKRGKASSSWLCYDSQTDIKYEVLLVQLLAAAVSRGGDGELFQLTQVVHNRLVHEFEDIIQWMRTAPDSTEFSLSPVRCLQARAYNRYDDDDSCMDGALQPCGRCVVCKVQSYVRLTGIASSLLSHCFPSIPVDYTLHCLQTLLSQTMLVKSKYLSTLQQQQDSVSKWKHRPPPLVLINLLHGMLTPLVYFLVNRIRDISSLFLEARSVPREGILNMNGKLNIREPVLDLFDIQNLETVFSDESLQKLENAAHADTILNESKEKDAHVTGSSFHLTQFASNMLLFVTPALRQALVTLSLPILAVQLPLNIVKNIFRIDQICWLKNRGNKAKQTHLSNQRGLEGQHSATLSGSYSLNLYHLVRKYRSSISGDLLKLIKNLTLGSIINEESSSQNNNHRYHDMMYNRLPYDSNFLNVPILQLAPKHTDFLLKLYSIISSRTLEDLDEYEVWDERDLTSGDPHRCRNSRRRRCSYLEEMSHDLCLYLVKYFGFRSVVRLGIASKTLHNVFISPKFLTSSSTTVLNERGEPCPDTYLNIQLTRSIWKEIYLAKWNSSAIPICPGEVLGEELSDPWNQIIHDSSCHAEWSYVLFKDRYLAERKLKRLALNRWISRKSPSLFTPKVCVCIGCNFIITSEYRSLVHIKSHLKKRDKKRKRAEVH